jgi:D-alanine-D-alanine ligase
MFQTSGKPLAKARLRDRGLATPRWYTLDALATDEWLPGRYIVKSAWEEASVGLDEDSVVQVDHPWALKEEIERRLPTLGGEGFAEAYIDGREFNLSVLAGPDGPEVLPPAEIDFVGYGEGKPRVVGYRAKWDESSYEYHHTPRRFDLPRSDGALIARLSAIAEACWRLFGLHGWARVDFRVDAEGRPWVLEVNANPCLSPDAGFAAAVERAGIGYTRAIERILQDVERGPARADRMAAVIPHGRP